VTKLIIKLLLNAFALMIVAYLVPGFTLGSYQAVAVASVVMGVVNTFIKPVFQVLLFPISLITLGIGAFLINVLLLWGVSYIVPGFEISSFTVAVISSAVLSLVSMFLHKLAQ